MRAEGRACSAKCSIITWEEYGYYEARGSTKVSLSSKAGLKMIAGLMNQICSYMDGKRSDY